MPLWGGAVSACVGIVCLLSDLDYLDERSLRFAADGFPGFAGVDRNFPHAEGAELLPQSIERAAANGDLALIEIDGDLPSVAAQAHRSDEVVGEREGLVARDECQGWAVVVDLIGVGMAEFVVHGREFGWVMG